jgi:single-strand DNA-binding protein
MTSSIKNSVQLIGNVGKDVNLVSYDNGSKKLSLAIATNEYYTNNKGEKIPKYRMAQYRCLGKKQPKTWLHPLPKEMK